MTLLIFALIGWGLAVLFFAVLCVVALQMVEADKKLSEASERARKAETAAARVADACVKYGVSLPDVSSKPLDYDRLAQAMSRHHISLSELRASRVRQGLDEKPAGWFGEHES
jgi:Flp pilus assembly protein CpaB